MGLNLYLIKQYEKTGLDTCDAAVVVALSFEDARRIHPIFPELVPEDWPNAGLKACWASSPYKVEVIYLGQARPWIDRGVVCASFNAG